jgi:hypothetical protein
MVRCGAPAGNYCEWCNTDRRCVCQSAKLCQHQLPLGINVYMPREPSPPAVNVAREKTIAEAVAAWVEWNDTTDVWVSDRLINAMNTLALQEAPLKTGDAIARRKRT